MIQKAPHYIVRITYDIRANAIRACDILLGPETRDFLEPRLSLFRTAYETSRDDSVVVDLISHRQYLEIA